MKRILSYYTKLFVFCQVLVLFMTLFTPVLSSNASASSANNFYFTDAVFDYYLDRAEDGTSKMHVEETLTAVFPDTNQNHGITRSIPYTNQGGTNVTAESKNALNFKVKRNGKNENVAKTSTENGAYIFYVGDKNTYVHGEQVYNLSYDFTNVITRFSEMTTEQVQCIQAPCPAQSALHEYQEIYWDTNGTGWSQTFENLTANLHLPDDVMDKVLTSQTSCYVGRYGSNNQSRCRFYKSDSNTITFTTTNLKAGENLTFAVDFEPGTFVIEEMQRSYLLVILTVIHAIVACGVIAYVLYKHSRKNHDKKSYYKDLFVAPQYQPYKGVTVAEAEKICVESVKSSKVATLLELAVNKKIQIIRTEKDGVIGKKKIWKIKMISSKNLTEPQTDIIKLLHGGSMPADGTEFEVKKQTYSYSLARINRSYPTDAEAMLKSSGFLEADHKPSGIIYLPILFFFLHIMAFTFAIALLFDNDLKYFAYGACLFTTFGIDFIGIFLSILLPVRLKDYAKYTEKGLDLSNYYRGLKLYITMAEKDRLEFLQSVKGADTSDKGIVKLYEKLLPYACLFGVEKSWMEELNKYYDRIADYDPYWYYGDGYITGYMLGSMMSSVNSSISSGSMSSSSSSSSGGGGGGFSGGGGGGGGGGGW
ncbi:DUF2207 domain-containing protein [Candidatus Saccharibacteria bacterium]|nr:DUF2207 domain-containing protein [Candidatus Saccharibacteria bacterium]